MNLKKAAILLILTSISVVRLCAIDVAIDTKLFKGKENNLVDGNPSTSITFPTAKKAPTTVTITLKLDKPEKLAAIELVSESINKWWKIKGIELLADYSGKGKFELVKKEKWYDRGKKNDAETFIKKIALNNRNIYAVKVILKRSHPFVWMKLNEIKLIKSAGSTLHGKLNLISSSLAPDSGILGSLFKGKKVCWNGGKGKPSTVILSVILKENAALQKVVLKSPSINKWWFISHVKIIGIKQGKNTLLLDKEWYNRGKDSTSKEFSVECPANQTFDKLRIELARPHGFINMALSNIQLVYANQINAKITSKWNAYKSGQKCRFKVSLNSNCKTPVEGSLKIIMDNGINNKKIAERKIVLKPGNQIVNLNFVPDKIGTFKLTPEFVCKNSSIRPVLTASGSGLINIVPTHSKYFMPIGTAHGSAQSGALGFRVRHDWDGKFFKSEKKFDKFNRAINEELVASCCNTPIKVGGDNPYMINAKGEKVKRHCFHAPHSLDKKVIKNLEYWDGHPGLFEFVYYNEHGYHTWHVKGLCDYNPYTLALYRKWLEDKHKKIAALNNLYGTKYKSFARVEPPKEFNKPDAAWFDWMEFRRFSYAKYLKDAYSLLKPHLKNTRITPKPISFDYYTSSGGNDPWLYKGAYDVFGYDIYPFQREGYLDPAMSLDFHRTQAEKGKKIHFLESNFGFRRTNQTEKTAEDMHLLYWPAFLRGLDGIYFYCWYQSWSKRHSGYWLRRADGVLTPQGQGAAAIAKEAQTLAPVLKTGKVLGVQAAVYFPWEEISQTPNVAPISALRGAYKIFTQLHYQTEFVTWHNIMRGDLSKYKVLALPLTRHIRPEVAAKIDEFVKNGGLLIGEYQAGMYDQYHRKQDAFSRVFGIKQNGVNDGQKRFAYGKKEKIKLYKPITKVTPFGWRHRPNITPIPRAENITVTSGKAIGTFPDKTPAIVENKYGKGETLYFASTFFNSYRNYFYTQCTMPNPATRGNEIINVGDRNYRKIVKDFLYSHNIKPVADVELYSEDVEEDESPFQILSLFGNKHCVLFGITNWGPHRLHNVKTWVELPFNHVKKLYAMDTTNESLQELPFKLTGNRLDTIVPRLDKSVVLIIINDQGPLLVEAVQKGPGQAVDVKLMNYLPETAQGYVQLRVDGRTTPISKRIEFKIGSGQNKSINIPLKQFDPEILVDAAGKRRPWYVWVVYDGDARSFARVRLPAKMTAP